MVTETIIKGYKYVSKRDHRDNTPIKSQWIINLPNEYLVFESAVDMNWRIGKFGWGLHLVGSKAQYLGMSATINKARRQLFIAFFEFSTVCHGYPSDVVRSTRETPPDAVRASWLEAKYLRPATIRKLGRGLPCKL